MIVKEAARVPSIGETALDKLVVASAVAGLAVVVDAETESVEDADADVVEGATVDRAGDAPAGQRTGLHLAGRLDRRRSREADLEVDHLADVAAVHVHGERLGLEAAPRARVARRRDHVGVELLPHGVARRLVVAAAHVGEDALPLHRAVGRLGRRLPRRRALARGLGLGGAGGRAGAEKQRAPRRLALTTECSLSDNLAALHPQVEMIRPCAMCPHMKRSTLTKIRRSLETMTHEVRIEPAVADRARASVDAMLAIS